MNTMRKKIIIAGAFLAALGGGAWYYASIEQGPIYEFEYTRDAQPLLSLFRDNWYWLVSSPDYSPEYMLKYRAPNKNPLYMGRLNIKVLREDDQFVGFTAYYKKSSDVGLLLFLAVDASMRGKRYGQQLIEYATQDLIRLGAKRIDLVTRTDNISAQKLYNRVGYQETGRDDTYVYFQYIP